MLQMRIAGRARHGLTVTQMDATGTDKPRTVAGFTATAIRTTACQVRFAVSSSTEKGVPVSSSEQKGQFLSRPLQKNFVVHDIARKSFWNFSGWDFVLLGRFKPPLCALSSHCTICLRTFEPRTPCMCLHVRHQSTHLVWYAILQHSMLAVRVAADRSR